MAVLSNIVSSQVEVHKKFGSLPWSELVQPAIDLATRGYLVTEKQQKSFDGKKNEFIEVNGENTFYAKKHEKGDIVINLPLANTLKLIQENGRAGFYQGVNAERFINRVKNTGGIISKEDLKNYYPVWRKPIQFEYKELTITSMAPPSSGGVCLGQMLKLENHDLKAFGHNNPRYVSLLTEVMKYAYADRSKYLGDPDYFKVPVSSIINKDYAKIINSNISVGTSTPSSEILPGALLDNESFETTHYSIVDQMGNAVAVTTTLNGSYGSKVFVEEGGYFLNNEMDDFSSKPGVPNMFGLLGEKQILLNLIREC